MEFVGADNFIRMFKDPEFWEALWHSTKFTIITAPIIVVSALILALLANRTTHYKKFLRICYYLPCVLSVSVASFLSEYTFTPIRGLVNGILESIGLVDSETAPLWLQNVHLVWFVIIIMTVWWTTGFSMLLYLSALQNVPEGVREAAKIDGATKPQTLFYIILPLLRETTWLVALLQIIACYKVFGQIYIMTSGGPGNSTRPLVQYIYQQGFSKNAMGYSAAMSYVLFVILAVVSMVQLKLQRRKEMV
ncbi:carbohydrate ABC transporter permease [Bilifractor sp. HCP3S3_D3]|uniref:carbohydrate ABC transporter permease n=1 Tax=Bilifractor sp. HCP3S3_D3 TaxID=3438907 RepID=UPI003F8B1DF0